MTDPSDVEDVFSQLDPPDADTAREAWHNLITGEGNPIVALVTLQRLLPQRDEARLLERWRTGDPADAPRPGEQRPRMPVEQFVAHCIPRQHEALTRLGG